MTIEGVTIRDATIDDAAACARILNNWIDDRPWMPRVHTHDEVVAFYRDFVLVNRRVLVAGDPVVGFMAMDVSAPVVTALYVSRPGHGLGRRLIEVAKSRRDRLDLWTFQANLDARRFYAREGFREVRRTEGENEEGLPDILLRWTRAGA
jgi:GNAT superfamily N-acetyltransferase